jgi:hypothetical protein
VTLGIKSGAASITNNTLTLLGAGSVTLTADQAGDSTYLPATQITGVLTVPKGSQTVSLPIPTNPVYGATNILLGNSSSGLPITSYSVIGGTAAKVTASSITFTNLGSVTLQALQAGNSNYLASSNAVTFTVAKAPQTIAPFATNLLVGKTFGDPAFKVTIPAASSKLPVILTVKSGPAITNAGSIRLTGVGTVTLAANQAGNTFYLPAPEVTVSFLSAAPDTAGLLIYGVKGTNAVLTGTNRATQVLGGYLVLDRTGQAGTFIWTNMANAYLVENRSDLASCTTGIGTNTLSVHSAAALSGSYPNITRDLIWLTGTNAYYVLGSSRILAPKTLTGLVNSITPGISLELQSPLLTLDTNNTLLARSNNETLAAAVNRLTNSLAFSGLVAASNTPAPSPSPVSGWSWTATSSNALVTRGASVTYGLTNVTAVPSPVSYQWLLDGRPIAKATNATLTLTNVDASAQGLYSVLLNPTTTKVTTDSRSLSVRDTNVLVYTITSAPLRVWSSDTNQLSSAGGYLLLDRTAQQASCIWTTTNNTYSVENRPDLANHATGIQTNSTLLLSSVALDGTYPNQEREIVWLTGTNRLIALPSGDRIQAPASITGPINTLLLTPSTTVANQSLSLTLDTNNTSAARANNESLSKTLSRLTNQLNSTGWISR